MEQRVNDTWTSGACDYVYRDRLSDIYNVVGNITRSAGNQFGRFHRDAGATRITGQPFFTTGVVTFTLNAWSGHFDPAGGMLSPSFTMTNGAPVTGFYPTR